MTLDHYAGAGSYWAKGASLVYGPIAERLVSLCPNDLAGRVVLDAGAGTGLASAALLARGAQPVAVDLSLDMLSWGKGRPPAAVGDALSLPICGRGVDDVVASFVFNHLPDPVAGMSEAARVARRGGALLACVFSNDSRSGARDVADEAARSLGWETPAWYAEMKANVVPLLGTSSDMERAAKDAGLIDVDASEVEVDVGITRAEDLVEYRFGQAHFVEWLASLGSDREREVKARVAEVVRPVMTPYRPIVVFLVATVP